MSRVGWIFLTLALLFVATVAATTRFGGDAPVLASVKEAVRRVRPAGTNRDASSPSADLPVLIVPVAGVARAQVGDTWEQARGEGRVHHGTDIPAPGGTAVVAAADGRVEKLFTSDLGGLTLYERSRDGRWVYYYAHLSGYAPGIAEGVAVRAGQPVALVGDTGDAGAGNTHLHFGLTRMAAGERWWQGEPVNAFPALAGRAAPR